MLATSTHIITHRSVKGGGDGGPETRTRDGRRTSRRAGAPSVRGGEFERGGTEYCGAAGIA